MAAVLTHGKRMLRASLKKQEEKNACSPQKRRKRVDPGKDAEWWCHVGLDKDGFSLKYISDYKGYGVFTNEKWKRGDFLLEYFGERINIQEAEERERKYVKDGMKMFYIFLYRFNGKQECIDATCTQGRLCQYVNDAYPEPPNCVMKLKKFQNQKKPRLCLFALRDIRKGEELVYDYGDETRNLWWRKKKNRGKNNEMLSSIVSDDDPFDLDKSYIPDASSDYVSDSITSSNQSACINILSSMSDTVTISAVSYTPTNEVDPISDNSDTPPSSSTNITTTALPLEEATIPTVITNQAASTDTASAPLSDIVNMTNKPDTDVGDPTWFPSDDGQGNDSVDSCEEFPALKGMYTCKEWKFLTSNEEASHLKYPVDVKCKEMVNDSDDDCSTIISDMRFLNQCSEEQSHLKFPVDVQSKEMVNDSDDDSSTIISDMGFLNQCSEEQSHLKFPVDVQSKEMVDDISDDDCNTIINGIGFSNQAGIVIQTTNTDESKKQKWDKKHACSFCGKLIGKIARHYEACHSDEQEVVSILSLPKNSQQRRQGWKVLCNEGDFKHNFHVFKKGEGVLIPKYRPSNCALPGRTREASELVPCPSCKGLYCEKELVEHQKQYCITKSSESLKKKKGSAVKEGKLLLPIPKNMTETFYSNVVNSMKKDEISKIVKNDLLIINYGQRLWNKKDIEEHTANFVSNKMRELGRFLKEMKILVGLRTLEECFESSEFESVTKSVKIMAEYSEKTNTYKKPSVALKLGYSLKKCAQIIRSEGLKEKNQLKVEKGNTFIQLYESDWGDLVSCTARQSLESKKFNNPLTIPFCGDVKELYDHLKKSSADLREEIKSSTDVYASLAKVTLCEINLFNRKRGGEVQRMKVSEFERASEISCAPLNAEVRTSLSEIEQRLCDSLMRVEVRGKFGKRVAILLTPNMIENIRTLLRYRKAANVVQTEYLFARPGNAQHPYRGPDVLRELCNNCNLEYPDAITWTGLRKHVATIAQVMEITETMQDQLAGFLGHDIRIHRDFYRLPLSVLQKSKVAQILLKASSQEDFKELEKSPKEWKIETGDVLVPEEEKGEIENEEIKTGNGATEQWEISNKLKENAEVPVLESRNICTSTVPVPALTKRDKSTKSKTPRRPWTSEERIAVLKHFSCFIRMLKVPRQEDVLIVLAKEPCLGSRSWRNIKDYVYNQIQRAKINMKL